MPSKRKPLTAQEHLEAVRAMCEREIRRSVLAASNADQERLESTRCFYLGRAEAARAIRARLNRRLAALKRARKETP